MIFDYYDLDSLLLAYPYNFIVRALVYQPPLQLSAKIAFKNVITFGLESYGHFRVNLYKNGIY